VISNIGEGRTLGYAAHGAMGMLTLFMRGMLIDKSQPIRRCEEKIGIIHTVHILKPGKVQIGKRTLW
jgi:hypothetical protein